jgi:MFS family permease
LRQNAGNILALKKAIKSTVQPPLPSELPILTSLLTAARKLLLQRFASDAALNQRDFRHFWATASFNAFSEQISGLALPLTAALVLHASPAQMGTLVALQTLPFVLFSLPVGVWLDRRAKFPILFANECLLPLVLLSIPCAWWLGMLAMPLLYLVSFLLGVGYVVGGSASQIFLAHLVGREKLIDAQSRFAATESLARLLGPGIAGLLVQWLSAPITLLVDAVVFAISSWNLSFIKRRDAAPEAGGDHPLQELLAGLKFVRGHPTLWVMAWSMAAWNMLFGGYQSLQVLFATRDLHLSPGMLGAMQMLGGLGVLVSSVLVKPLTTHFGSGATILLGIAGSALGWILLIFIPAHAFGTTWGSAALYGAVMFLFDCSVLLFIMPYLALRLKLTPDAMLGRMISTMRFLSVSSVPLGAIAGGWLGEHLQLRPAIAVIAASGVVLTLILLASPLRNVSE